MDRDVRYLEKVKDLVDQNIDIMLNYRQSGHPGGSRSKIPALLTLLLGGAMKWDIRHPLKRYADRFILGAGHTIPAVYAVLAVLNEAMRLKYLETGEEKYNPGKRTETLFWEDLLGFRRKGGLSGHAEFEKKTQFIKFNTGPSGHGLGAAAGQAVALRRAGAGNVKVFVLEGEGGLTPGVTHEIANSAYGLALNNFFVLVDWNDFGIDGHKISDVVYGTPPQWFESHGWLTYDSGSGEDWETMQAAFKRMVDTASCETRPAMTWFRTRKGRGYMKFDAASHGAPHGENSQIFWDTKKDFMEKYGVAFHNAGGSSLEDRNERYKEFSMNLKVVADVLAADRDLYTFIADRLVSLGDSVPEYIEGSVCESPCNPFADEHIYSVEEYPEDLFMAPGKMAPNRAALGTWGAWLNAYGHNKYGRPYVIASSADLSESTNISGFGKAYREFPGYGWFEKVGSVQGALLPQEITEFANSAIMTGIASTNLSVNPLQEFNGFWAATSTYASFSYLIYGMLRLYSQMEQDSPIPLGKVLYVAGHTGPETADDSRTHFGIFSPGVTQLFPEGHVINLYPWEYNEVPVLLAAAMKLKKPGIVVIHLTRPAIEIPDRKKLKMPSHFEASKGAYVVRDYSNKGPRQGTFYVQGTAAMANLVKILPELDKRKLNVKLVYVSSPQLFALQREAYRRQVVDDYDRTHSTLITTSSKKLMPEFTFQPEALDYALSPDWDDRWRTGGTLEEILDEAHLSPEWILQGIERFAEHVGRG